MNVTIFCILKMMIWIFIVCSPHKYCCFNFPNLQETRRTVLITAGFLWDFCRMAPKLHDQWKRGKHHVAPFHFKDLISDGSLLSGCAIEPAALAGTLTSVRHLTRVKMKERKLSSDVILPATIQHCGIEKCSSLHCCSCPPLSVYTRYSGA